MKVGESRSQLVYPNEREKTNKQAYERRYRPACKNRRFVKIEYRPGQLVYRRMTKRGRTRDPVWVSPYLITKKVSEVVYGVQVGTREIHAKVEDLKLCRATREELRHQRRERRRRVAEEVGRYNHPPPDRDIISETDASSTHTSCSYREDYYNPPVREKRERRETEGDNPGVGDIQSSGESRQTQQHETVNDVTGDERNIAEFGRNLVERDNRYSGRDRVREASDVPATSSGSPRYSLRPRVDVNYRE
jgi:hypothetical protein